MSDSHSLRITPQATAAPLTPEHKRFYMLIKQIEKARANLAAWREQDVRFRQGYEQHRATLHGDFLTTMNEWVLALDRAMAKSVWTRRERDTLRQLLCRDVASLLEIAPSDALKALFEKHSAVDLETSRREQMARLKDVTERFTGVDLGDTSNIDSKDDLLDHIQEKLAAEQDAWREREARNKQSGRKSPAQQRREQEAQRVTQSVRDIYRKLVSVLHPDREPDAQARAAKNELMQKVNQAYEANDLLTLLEVQLQIEQVNQAQLQSIDTEHIKRYNKVLYGQVASLRDELEGLREGLELDFNLMLDSSGPRQLERLLERSKRQLRDQLTRHRRELRMLNDVPATKRWLRRALWDLQDADLLDDLV